MTFEVSFLLSLMLLSVSCFTFVAFAENLPFLFLFIGLFLRLTFLWFLESRQSNSGKTPHFLLLNSIAESKKLSLTSMNNIQLKTKEQRGTKSRDSQGNTAYGGSRFSG